jgi:hypothetical protein
MEFLVLLLGIKSSKAILGRKIRPRRMVRKYRRNLIFISKVIVELCELITLIVVTFYKSFRWAIRKAFRLNQTDSSVSQSTTNVINLADYRAKKKIS